MIRPALKMRLTALAFAAACAFSPAAMAQGVCPPQAKMQGVEMAFTNIPPVVTNDKNSAELGEYKISTTFARSQNEIFTVGGLHLSELAPQYIVSFEISDAGGGMACIAPVGVRISIEYAPRVMVASDYPPGSCRYKVIIDHEIRHVSTDVITLNEFLPGIRKAVEETARALQPMGPMQESSLEKAKGMFVDQVRERLVREVDQFQKIRFLRQQLIDTRQQYMLESRLCPRGE